VYHETASSFQPVEEGFYLRDPQRVKAFQKKLWYYPDFGRGDVQLTHKDNYVKMQRLVPRYFPEVVSEFESRTGKKFDLINHPEQVMDGQISFCIMTIGMHLGEFRGGHNLDRHINHEKCDYFYARFIINGVPRGQKYPDKADVIKAYAVNFEKILRSALESTEPAVQIIPAKPVQEFDHAEFDNNFDSTGGMDEYGQPEPGTDMPPAPVPEPAPQPKEVVIESTKTAESSALKAGDVLAKAGKWFGGLTAGGGAGLWLSNAIGKVTGLNVDPVVLKWVVLGFVSLVVMGVILLGVGAIAYIIGRFILTNRREARTHELNVAALQAAADPKLNTVHFRAPLARPKSFAFAGGNE
jgi:type IV secretory pathway VirB3-like protein